MVKVKEKFSLQAEVDLHKQLTFFRSAFKS